MIDAFSAFSMPTASFPLTSAISCVRLGIDDIIIEAYCWLCSLFDFETNVQDEIHLVGFSRGAFTARCLACFIEDVGLIRPKDARHVPKVYLQWAKAKGTSPERFHDWPVDMRPKQGVTITTCAAWDTVNALSSSRLNFVESRVPKTLACAFQALALHEKRPSFLPVLWNRHSGSSAIIQQCWFAGDHTDIGGGHPDYGLANLSFLWMLAQYNTFTKVKFNEKKILGYLSASYFEPEDNTHLSMTFSQGRI